MKKHINLHVFRVCIVFGIYPKILSKIMDLTLKFVQFKGYNLIYFLYQPLIKDPHEEPSTTMLVFIVKPSRKPLNKFGKPSRTLIIHFYFDVFSKSIGIFLQGTSWDLTLEPY